MSITTKKWKNQIIGILILVSSNLNIIYLNLPKFQITACSKNDLYGL